MHPMFYSWLSRFILIGSLLFTPSIGWTNNLLEESASLLKHSRLVYHTQPSLQEYILVKSAIKKVNNQWRANEERIYGTLERKTYMLEESFTYKEASVLLKQALTNREQYISIFQCEGLDCGSSNGWANQFLNIKQLYGLDVYQLYAVAQGLQQVNSTQTIHVFYLVQRGNRRVYLQHDKLVRDAPAVESVTHSEITKSLETGSKKVLTLYQAADVNGTYRDALKRILAILEQEPNWRLRIVGHNYSANSLQDRTAMSKVRAEEILEQLKVLGLNPAQVSVHGVGSLAPGALDAIDRVELIIEHKDES